MKSFFLKIGTVILAIICSFAFLIIVHGLDSGKNNVENFENLELPQKPQRTLDFDTSLRDKNVLHLKYAVANGLKETYKTDSDFLAAADSLVLMGELILISDKKSFVVEELTHSHPYLTEKAYDLLSEIGKRFQEKQAEHKLKPRKMIVTSLLRTEKSQSSLRRRNVNATRDTTAHLFGTTFDIAKNKFVKKDFFGNNEYYSGTRYQRLLEEVLKELREEGRCVVAREKRQACFHITVVE